jgi:hypothetical protein
VDCFFVNRINMTYTHNTGKSSMTLGNGRFTAYFTRLMGVPLTLLSRMRHAAWMWAIIWLGARLTAQNAHVQLIHTVADVVGVGLPAFPIVLDSVDVYISLDSGATWTLAVPDFKFRQARPFLQLPANSNQLLAGIAPGNSSSSAEILLPYPIPSLAPNTYYVAAIAGTIDFSNLDVDVDIYYFSPARNATTGSGANDVDILLFHGSPDAGPVSYYWAYDMPQHAYVRDGHLSYKGYSSGYRTLSSDDILVLGDSADANIILPQGFYYPERSDAFWDGQSAGVIFVSGYLNESNPAKQLGVHIALPDGTVRPLSPQDVRRLQIVHNAADPALAQVDIHLGTFPDPYPLPLDFRQATPAIFFEGTGNVTLIFSARGNRTTPLATVNLTLPPAGYNAAVFAQGVVNPSDFAPNPDNISTAFGLKAFTGVKGVESAGNFAAMAFHGVTDAPTVDVEIEGVGTVSNLSYGSSSAAPVTFASGVARRVNVNVGSSTVASFNLSQAQARDQVGAIIFASGFLDPANNPANNNQNSPAFGLYIVYPTDEVQPLSLASGINRGPIGEVRVSTWPTMAGSWTVAVSAGAASKLPYRLVSTTGQVLQEGTWEVPGAGSWVYTVPADAYSAGVYLLQVGESTYRLLK